MSDAPRRSAAALDRLAASAATALDVSLVTITVVDPSGHVGVAAHHPAIPERAQPSPLCREVAARGRPIVLTDARRRLPHTLRRGPAFDIVGYAGVPLPATAAGESGTFAVSSPYRRSWRGGDLGLLRSLAETTSAILELDGGATEDRRRITIRDHRISPAELERTAGHDPLTGLLNRRGLLARGNAWLDVLRRDGMQGFLLFLDVDGLKGTNDAFGLAAGDVLLCGAAEVLRRTFQGIDTIARLGGDEFVVIAAMSAPVRHDDVLARLAAQLQRHNVDRDSGPPLRWSVGTVAIDPAAPNQLDALLAEGDRRMYAAKRMAPAV